MTSPDMSHRPSNTLTIAYVPGAGVPMADATYVVAGDTTTHLCSAEKGYGIFGKVNQSTSFAQIRDGTSNTIMTGELQRITNQLRLAVSLQRQYRPLLQP